MNIPHSVKYFLRIFEYLCERVGHSATIFFRVVKTIQFLKISLVGFFEVALYVCKVYDVAVAIILIWAVDASQSLKKIVVFQFSAEVKALQTRSVKSCQQHIEHNQHIYGHIFLEVLNYLLSGLLIVCIVENKFCLDVGRERGIFVHFSLHLIPIHCQVTGLSACLADNHTSESIVAMLLT